MKYSDEEEAFEYWSDAPLNFNILETVARKYVKTFLCSDVFIDREKELFLCGRSLDDWDTNLL